ncbi:hypothetical protein JCM9279_005656 [Rhodotorula babjevae]
MNVRKAITILVILIALILAGTVAVLTTVVQYFGVDQRDVITEPEMRLYERLAATARSNLPIPDKSQKVVGGADAEPLAAPVKSDEQLSPELVVTRDDAERGDESVQDLLNRLDERGWFSNSTSSTAVDTAAAAAEPEHKQKIPKIIHATWKTDTVPVRWAEVRQGCIDLHPDYEFKLWSDAASRAFIAEHYPWFLSTFDGYKYPIQRADVIRYFVLHHFGGIYMDLDIGCRRNLDPFLYFDVILPATIPVGVSNDLMFAERGHPFMDLVIHNLITFDHSYGTNYPTVMFSTGPMFVSAVYGMWPKDVDEGVERQVRILPRRWYGKNAPATEMQESYFDHFYGSSWHADDAGFITFLGKFGIALMYVGLGIVVLGVVRLVWNKRPAALKTPRTIGPIALPYEALPFARPGTPGSGSRPASPSHGGSSSSGSRLGTPAGRYRDDGKPSGLFYMPVWLYPSGSSDRGTPGPRPSGGGGVSPGAGVGGQQNWSQYFSNLSFVNDEAAANAHRQHEHQHGGYAPVPSFSRPPSPSNNSILHAPGSTHDGAFDGMPLHSIHAPRAHKASASTSSSSPSSPSSSHFPSSSSPTTSNPPLSPNPPAYSSLRSWGTSLFRGGVPSSFPAALGGAGSPSSAARQPLLPVAHAGGRDSVEARRVHLDAAPGSGGGGGGLGLGGPPEYVAALAVAAGPGAPGPLVDARGGPARAGRGGDPARQDRRGGAPAAAAAASAGDRAVERPAGALVAGGGGGGSVSRRSSFAGDEESLEEQLDRELAGFDGRRSGRASPALLAADEGRVGPGAVEEEVDRLLSELAPEQGDEDDGREGKKAE